MPRRTTRRTVVKPRKRWQMQLYQMNNAINTDENLKRTYIEVPANTSFTMQHEITQNSTASSTPTPSIVKVGNFQVKMYISCVPSEATVERIMYYLRAYIMFVPEGVTVTGAWMNQHPEYILAKGGKASSAFTHATAINQAGTEVPYNSAKALVNLQFSSRLKRNLNTGDKIMLVLIGNAVSRACAYTMYGDVQFFACTN